MEKKMINEQEKNLINAKMEEIQAILFYLNQTYGVNYALQFTKTDENYRNLEMFGNIHSEGIGVEDVLFFQNNLQTLKEKITLIPNLIKTGHILVECIVDSNKPENWNGEWLKKGSTYLVETIRPTANKEVNCYQLKGFQADLNPLFDGFLSNRFLILLVNEQQN